MASKTWTSQCSPNVKLPNSGTLSFCEGCVEGKIQRKPFKSVGEIRSKRRLELVHSDVCGPMYTESFGRKRYWKYWRGSKSMKHSLQMTVKKKSVLYEVTMVVNTLQRNSKIK